MTWNRRPLRRNTNVSSKGATDGSMRSLSDRGEGMGYTVNDDVGVGVRVQDFAVDLDGFRFADSESQWLILGCLPSPTVAARKTIKAMRHRPRWGQDTTSKSPSSGCPELLMHPYFRHPGNVCEDEAVVQFFLPSGRGDLDGF